VRPTLIVRARRSLRHLAFCVCVSTATAGEVATADHSKEQTPQPRFKLYGWIESGFTANFDDPADRQNFGHLFTDRSNELLLNQAVLTAERPLDPKAAGFDWGFKAQFLYGGDARYIHSVGIFQNTQHEIVQPDVVEAWMVFHMPIPHTSGGLDIKVGKFVTLEGAETIDPRTDVFYSHSYIFNFGIPFNHTGVLTTLHPVKWLDLYAGVTRGVNTSTTDNNGSEAFDGGIGFNLLDGKLTALATTHIGPENAKNNRDQRYLNDLVVTWKATDKLTAIIDGNFAMDESAPGNAKAYGVAAYLTYAVNGWLTLGIREEMFRDEKGFFVGSFADNDDFIDLERGKTNNIDLKTFFTHGTFNAVTIGATIKIPTGKPLIGLTVRPELRYDAALSSDVAPFSDRDARHQLTASIDAVLTF
jgi:hypothetical protein